MMAQVNGDNRTPLVFLGRSGVKVSNICLGTVTFGQSNFLQSKQCSEDESHRLLTRFTELGGNFLDTADCYGPFRSEEIIGRWLERQDRQGVVIATKVGHNHGSHPNSKGLGRRHLVDSLEGSLDRLKTSFVDLLQTHFYDEGTPLEETLRTFDDLIRVGKVRYVGVSNLTGWQLQKMVCTCQRLGLNPITSLQQQYSLVSRDSEQESFQVCKAEGVALLPWSPLKGGLLSGKFNRDGAPREGRIGWAASSVPPEDEIAPRWTTLDSRTFDIIETAAAIASRHGRSLAQVSIRWLLQKDLVSSVVIGATNLVQLEDNMAAAAGWSLSKQEMQQLDDVSAPEIRYPYKYLSKYNQDRINPWSNNYYVKSTSD